MTFLTTHIILLTSSGPSLANGLMAKEKANELCFSISAVHGTNDSVDLIIRGFVLPEIYKAFSELTSSKATNIILEFLIYKHVYLFKIAVEIPVQSMYNPHPHIIRTPVLAK